MAGVYNDRKMDDKMTKLRNERAANTWGAGNDTVVSARQQRAPGGAIKEMTQEQMIQGTKQMELDMLKSTQRALRDLDDAEQAGNAALEGLARQNEQIDDIAANLDRMRTDIAYSDQVLQKIASPFAFSKLTREGKEFETEFGSPAHWSGPMLKKGIFSSKQRYFVLVFSRLVFYDSSKKSTVPSNFGSPKGEMDIRGAKVSGNDNTLDIVIKKSSETWKLRAVGKNDFVGWMTMLERHSAGNFVVSKANATAGPAPNAAAKSQTAQQKAELLTTSQPQATTTKTVDQQVDDNLDLMMKKLDLLGAMACEQKQAIDLQNDKLDVVTGTMEATNNDMLTLQLKHKKRLKEQS